MNTQYFLFILIFGAVFLASSGLCASEKLRFEPAQSLFKALKVPEELSGNKVLAASADLNDDGLPELIFQRAATGGQSDFLVYGQNANKPDALTFLGAMHGTKILLSNDYKHGVRNLLVFNDINNDFAYQAFGWSSKSRQFELIQTTQLGASQ